MVSLENPCGLELLWPTAKRCRTSYHPGSPTLFPTQAIVACDFCVAIMATFQLLYVYVVMEHGSRGVLHANVTRHPTADWTLQQLREAIPSDQ